MQISVISAHFVLFLLLFVLKIRNMSPFGTVFLYFVSFLCSKTNSTTKKKPTKNINTITKTK